ncbi:MAG: serine/threonine-protein kinase [Ferrimicrobium sp.]
MSESIPLGGRYQLRGLLGRGGMGEVLDGWDTRLDRPVAIKVLRRELAMQTDLRRRFEAEAKAAATLNHPHVVAVFDSGEDDGVPYIVMERLPGRTLADEIASGPMPEGRVRKILIEMLEALVVAHDAGILHRDIKPGNVLFSAGGTVKVADFGIAKSTDTDQTMTGQILGTAAYLSPERLAGKPSSVVDDLYAVGVVGYEALCGRKPFAEENPLALIRAICDGQTPPLADGRPGLDSDLVAAIERAMARGPERRFSNARAMLGALSQHGTVIVVEPVSSDTQLFGDLTEVYTPTDTPSATEVYTPTDTPSATEVYTPTDTPSATEVYTPTDTPSATEVYTSVIAPLAPENRGTIERIKVGLSDRSRAVRMTVLVASFLVLLVVFFSFFVNSGSHGANPVPTTVAKSGTGSTPPSLAQALNNLVKSVQP